MNANDMKYVHRCECTEGSRSNLSICAKYIYKTCVCVIAYNVNNNDPLRRKRSHLDKRLRIIVEHTILVRTNTCVGMHVCICVCHFHNNPPTIASACNISLRTLRKFTTNKVKLQRLPRVVCVIWNSKFHSHTWQIVKRQNGRNVQMSADKQRTHA